MTCVKNVSIPKIRWSFRKRNKIAAATENKYEFFEVNPTF